MSTTEKIYNFEVRVLLECWGLSNLLPRIISKKNKTKILLFLFFIMYFFFKYIIIYNKNIRKSLT